MGASSSSKRTIKRSRAEELGHNAGDKSGPPVKRHKGGPTATPSSSSSSSSSPSKTVQHLQHRGQHSVVRGLLDQHYAAVQTLREYLLAKLPSTSRIRQRRIASVGREMTSGAANVSAGSAAAAAVAPECPRAGTLGQALDTILVCTPECREAEQPDPHRREKWRVFSRQGEIEGAESHVAMSSDAAVAGQSEVVDFCTWFLGSGKMSPNTSRDNLLCRGYGTGQTGLGATNHHAQTLKARPWPEILALLGKTGQHMMMDLILDHAIFLPVDAGFGNMYQVCGAPMYHHVNGAAGEADFRRVPSDIVFIRSRMMYARAATTGRGGVDTGFRHIHVLNRCRYVPPRTAAAAVPDSRDVCEDVEPRNEQNCIRIMMYMFPRQFGLHNVFDSPTDTSRTAQKLHDYTLREDEIAQKFGRFDQVHHRDHQQYLRQHRQPRPPHQNGRVRVPRRLRGEAKRLVQRLQILHGRCSYAGLLWHHCSNTVLDRARRDGDGTGGRSQFSKQSGGDSLTGPVQSGRPIQPGRRPGKSRREGGVGATAATCEGFQLYANSLVEAATPASRVSAFCRAVLSKIIPDDFWGRGPTRVHNKKLVLGRVDAFVKLRRFESMSLHDVTQDLKTADIPWLCPPGLAGKKCSLTDAQKRTEIFSEFLYYVFDSLVIPLVRSNFYVTESSAHRYRLFFFRHDVWKHVAEPAMAALKTSMFEEVGLPDALRILGSRSLGFSQVRLLPKGAGVRPIMNLRRRSPATVGDRHGSKSKTLGASVNSILGPVHSMLNLEKSRSPSDLGAAMFSVGDIYQRLKRFSTHLYLGRRGPGRDIRPLPRQKLYMAKVDVKAAFDTIPQAAVLRLMVGVPSKARYVVAKHVEIRPAEQGGCAKKWQAAALGAPSPADDKRGFCGRVEAQLAGDKRHTVFVDPGRAREYRTVDLLQLMAQHVGRNLVKIGKKFFRQKDGIPQGSVLSSLLCNYFYGDLEATHLDFVGPAEGERGDDGDSVDDNDDCLLLRLIDDFLLITTDRTKAERFVSVMHAGIPEYGVSVNPAKTLVNFELELAGGGMVERVRDGDGFPYCGTLIDCETLEMRKDRDRARDAGAVSNSLTVGFGRMAGHNFQRRTLKALKLQLHAMFFDTSHNSSRAVRASVYEAFEETATKMWAYVRSLSPRDKRPGNELIISTISQAVQAASALLLGRSRKSKYPGYDCSLKRTEIMWLGYHAFRKVLASKQTAYGGVIRWLDAGMEDAMAGAKP